ncbi:MAG: hypothetical protein D4R50_02890 [Actinomycetales bacterium]|nr:MAG: hypothetical protein D4R50_02890 [Actinomycetales bacterium]
MAQPLLAPLGGIPKLVEDESSLAEVITQLENGTGPIAIDAERASGYKYSARAYLIQIKRIGGGSHLIDPIAVGPTALWGKMNSTFATQEWVIHASTQDLPCLRELGISPSRIFDTELGGRIAGCERVGLGLLTERLLEIILAKEHSAVDWSRRPLPEEWLNYAALDVELLVELRDAISSLLEEQGKLTWAHQDFAAILAAPPAPPKKEPWRQTSGMHKVRDRITLAIIRELWRERDEYAREIDLAPGRVFNDETLLVIATTRPSAVGDFRKLIARRSRVTNLPAEKWFEILQAALTLPIEELPELRSPSQSLPPVKAWESRNPLGYARITHARQIVAELALENTMPPENLVSPLAIRQLCWSEPPAHASKFEEFVAKALSQAGARPWQISLVCAPIAGILGVLEPLTIEIPESMAPAEELS